ncbi:MAG: ATP-binding cassette domain-containing protein [Chloroflexi bacterium]|nr:ATP-binding cassette domain-containing protein [Chloroflexota bacterium]
MDEGLELSSEQIARIEHYNPCFKERHVESFRPGELLCADTFFVGTLKGIGKLYLHAVVDTYGSYAFGFLPVCRKPECAATLLHVDFHVNEGEIVGLIGDNGAGKSTLIKILTGFIPATSGEIYLHGKETLFTTPKEARDAGIETVYQEQALADDLTVTQNLFLGKELTKKIGPFTFLDKKAMARESKNMLEELRLRIPTDKETRFCSGGERQGVCIARVIYFQADLVILDEPTNALGVAAVNRVLELIKELKHRKIASIFISHNLHHVYSIVDRIVIFVNGHKIFDAPKAETTVEEINQMLIKRSGSLIME